MLFTNEGSLEDDIRFLESYGTACPDHARGQLEALLANLRKGAAAERFRHMYSTGTLHVTRTTP
ncbi:MAG: hypothetical protein IPG54_15045 [Sphingomonadales bacterium]|nr:hypothetical protein [Sphingomonadales bacterium]